MTIPNWSRAHGKPPVAGRLRQSADDFEVTELLGFEPDGNGEHDFLWIEKRHANTQWVARELASFAGIPVRDVGYAGLKDRHAVTRQWFSVRRPGGPAADWHALDVEGVSVVQVSRNSRKLRRGANKGNRFCIVVADVQGDAALLADRIDLIRRLGVPNYFGEQRFGHGGRNLGLASTFFAGKRLPREKRSIAISAARSWLFNFELQQRVVEQSWQYIRPGDVVSLDGSGSIFVVQEPDAELLERCRELDLHPAGLLWGRCDSDDVAISGSARRPSVDGYEHFAAALELHAQMSWRPLRLAVRDLAASYDDDSLTLEFYLARGSYATAVLREIANYSEAECPRGSS